VDLRSGDRSVSSKQRPFFHPLSPHIPESDALAQGLRWLLASPSFLYFVPVRYLALYHLHSHTTIALYLPNRVCLW
jgi:hypothetical protein